MAPKKNPAITDKIKALLEEGLQYSHADLEITPSGSVFGTITAPEFDGKTDRNRQQIVWQFLKQGLSEREQLKIAAILALTPDEEERMAGD